MDEKTKGDGHCFGNYDADAIECKECVISDECRGDIVDEQGMCFGHYCGQAKACRECMVKDECREGD